MRPCLQTLGHVFPACVRFGYTLTITCAHVVHSLTQEFFPPHLVTLLRLTWGLLTTSSLKTAVSSTQLVLTRELIQSQHASALASSSWSNHTRLSHRWPEIPLIPCRSIGCWWVVNSWLEAPAILASRAGQPSFYLRLHVCTCVLRVCCSVFGQTHSLSAHCVCVRARVLSHTYEYLLRWSDLSEPQFIRETFYC